MKPKIYLRDWNGILQEVRKTEEFEFVNDARDADCLVLWQDVRGELLELCRINREFMHKKVVVVQHGRGAERDYDPNLNNFEMIADKFCCWGKSAYDRLTKYGHKDKAVITGCPLINRLKPHEKHPEKNIVYLPVITMHEEPDNLITFYELKKIELEHSQAKLKQHRDILRKDWNVKYLNPESTGDKIPYSDISSDWRLISKLTGMHDKNLYLGSVTLSQQNGLTHIDDCVRLLTQTDVVVGMEEGTFQLLAMAMGIPCVMVDGFIYDSYGGASYENLDIIKTDGVVYTTNEGLRSTIEQELSNPERLQEERKRVVAEELGDLTSNPDDNIIKVIKGVL